MRRRAWALPDALLLEGVREHKTFESDENVLSVTAAVWCVPFFDRWFSPSPATHTTRATAMPTRKKRAAPDPGPEPSLEPEFEGPPSKRLRGPAAATATAIRPPVPLLSVQQYVSVVNKLLKMEAAAPFVEPLDYVGWNLPDYPKIVKHPMDLGTIKSKIDSGSYQRGEDVLKDVRRLGNLHAYRIAHRMRTACAPHHTACISHALGAPRHRQLLLVQRPGPRSHSQSR